MKFLALILAIIFVVLAILVATGSAHFASRLGVDGHHHIKHAVLYGVLALLCLIWLRFASSTPRR